MNDQIGMNIVNLIISIGSNNEKTAISAIYLLNGFINCVQENFEAYAETMMNFVLAVLKTCIVKKEDDYTRCVVGVLADISNYTPSVMTKYMPSFEQDIIEIMKNE
jgi:hypothetical protein